MQESIDLSGNKHAAVINSLIQDVLTGTGLRFSDLSAAAVSSGPGSYTGLRIGISAAKGLCYGAGIPLIAIPTLMALAWRMTGIVQGKEGIYIPMIDARRDDVYMAVYSRDVKIIKNDTFVTIDANLFDSFLRLYDSDIYFGGNGSNKMTKYLLNNNFGTIIENVQCVSSNLSFLSYDYFKRKDFADLIYYEPFYLKEFEGRMKIK